MNSLTPPPLFNIRMNKDTFTRPGLVNFLKKHAVGGALDKSECSFHDCGRYYKIESLEDMKQLRSLVVATIRGFRGTSFLNDIAPPVSRLFLDLDVNKKADSPLVSLGDVEEFVKGFSAGLRKAIHRRKINVTT